MAWIESHQSLRNHPKLRALAQRLQISHVQTIGHLHLLWWWCLDYAPEGCLRYPAPVIAAAAEWSGDADAFVTALCDERWLEEQNGTFNVHDWAEFRLHYDLLRERQERCRNQVRRRVKRWREKRISNAIGNAVVTQCNAANKTKRPKRNRTKHNKPNLTKESRRFAPPTPDAVTTYAQTLGYALDGHRFCDHYAAKGWVMGKSPMKNWQAAVRTWQAREEDHGTRRREGTISDRARRDRAQALRAVEQPVDVS